MTRQISIRWNSDMGQNYGASAQALKQYSPPPALSASVRLKGDMSELALQQLVDLASEYGMEVNVTLTATWADEADVQQLRLFGPKPRFVTPDGVIIEEGVAS